MGREWDEGSSRPSFSQMLNRRLLLAFLLILVVIVSLVLASETFPRSGRLDIAPRPIEPVTAV